MVEIKLTTEQADYLYEIVCKKQTELLFEKDQTPEVKASYEMISAIKVETLCSSVISKSKTS